jgi:hypothetical protein
VLCLYVRRLQARTRGEGGRHTPPLEGGVQAVTVGSFGQHVQQLRPGLPLPHKLLRPGFRPQDWGCSWNSG